MAAELRLKLGITVSPRTVRRYMPPTGEPRDRTSSQRWSTFVRNHAHHTLACDLFVTITAAFSGMDESNVRKAFERLLDAGRRPRRGPHQMRHTFASLLLQ